MPHNLLRRAMQEVRNLRFIATQIPWLPWSIERCNCRHLDCYRFSCQYSNWSFVPAYNRPAAWSRWIPVDPFRNNNTNSTDRIPNWPLALEAPEMNENIYRRTDNWNGNSNSRVKSEACSDRVASQQWTFQWIPRWISLVRRRQHRHCNVYGHHQLPRTWAKWTATNIETSVCVHQLPCEHYLCRICMQQMSIFMNLHVQRRLRRYSFTVCIRKNQILSFFQIVLLADDISGIFAACPTAMRGAGNFDENTIHRCLFGQVQVNGAVHGRSTEVHFFRIIIECYRTCDWHSAERFTSHSITLNRNQPEFSKKKRKHKTHAQCQWMLLAAVKKRKEIFTHTRLFTRGAWQQPLVSRLHFILCQLNGVA